MNRTTDGAPAAGVHRASWRPIRRIVLIVVGVAVAVGVGVGGMVPMPSTAARKSVSAAEIDGTFRSADGKTSLLLLSLGRGGLDNPGYGIQVEFRTTLRKGEPPLIFGGYGTVAADKGTFTPQDVADTCRLTLTFVKNGSLTVRQRGSCDLGRPSTLAGSYRKSSTKRPAFTDLTGVPNESLFASFVGGVGTNRYSGTLSGRQRRGYKVDLKANQVLSLDIAPSERANLSLFGPDGELEPDSGGMSSMSGKFEKPGVYEIVVSLNPPFDRHYVEYDYTVTIGVNDQV